MGRSNNSDISYFQQGDCLFAPAEIPKGCEKITGGVVQEGELTGHAHRFDPSDVQLFEHKATKERFVRVLKPTALAHEEHKEIMFPAGDYKIGIIQEYDPFSKMQRQVID